MITKEVWRYQVPLGGRVALNLPRGAQFCSFGYQPARDEFCAWFLVNPKNTPDVRYFHATGTGHSVEEAAFSEPLGSTIMPDGFHVFHLIELLGPDPRDNQETTGA